MCGSASAPCKASQRSSLWRAGSSRSKRTRLPCNTAASGVLAACQCCRSALGMAGSYLAEQLAVLDKPRAAGDAVVQLACLGVVFLGQPVHAVGTGGLGSGIHLLDQRATDATTAYGFGHVQVLQVAVVADRPARAMEDPVHQPDRHTVLPGQRGKHRLGRVEKTLPGEGADLGRNVGVIEALVALPQRQPGGVIGGGDGANL